MLTMQERLNRMPKDHPIRLRIEAAIAAEGLPPLPRVKPIAEKLSKAHKSIAEIKRMKGSATVDDLIDVLDNLRAALED